MNSQKLVVKEALADNMFCSLATSHLHMECTTCQ